ncbi:hypothetical protein L2E82_41333 [Cichorium intybus]|uniref:Uncharacterized protein n=1 Tax=Cichorium intybus TaxID=13427 RepID=A0ACB9ANV9_CICIN|nr:hypothetical protein L2E82_41333 [Cichorium intybus]
MREIKSFMDVILGYFNVCSDGSNGDEDSTFVRSLVDIVSIWVYGEGTGNQLKRFFPLLSDEIINLVAEEPDGVIGLLAGAVILEMLLELNSMKDVFVAAAHAMRYGTNGNGKKRKETSVEKNKD